MRKLLLYLAFITMITGVILSVLLHAISLWSTGLYPEAALETLALAAAILFIMAMSLK